MEKPQTPVNSPQRIYLIQNIYQEPSGLYPLGENSRE